jgi:UDP-N-acetylglucosamine 4,6-dehydratase/5-epimerase
MAKPSILITGGTGFLGRHLGRALRAKYAVVLGGRNHDQNRLAHEFTGCPVLALDVANIEAVRDAVAEVRPDILIHAAASKYVDIAERQPMECLDVNVTGSQNVARVAVEKGVGVVLGISTDKSAPPVANTYGLTKALMERLFCAMDGKADTAFACVRFGNLPWSTGSVFPIWKRMHAETGMIGSTGPNMTRLFTPVDEAVELVTTALRRIDELHGRVLTRAMKSARIRDILDVWVKHLGGHWKPIEGRPGERLHESLIGEGEFRCTSTVEYDGIEHYVLAFNTPASDPLPAPLTSADAARFSDLELLDLITRPPAGAL